MTEDEAMQHFKDLLSRMQRDATSSYPRYARGIECFGGIQTFSDLKMHLKIMRDGARADINCLDTLFDNLADVDDDCAGHVRNVSGLCAKILLMRMGEDT